MGVIELLRIVHQKHWSCIDDGSVSKLGVPLFVESDIKILNNVVSHFSRVILDPKQVEVKFLNQVRVITVNNAPIESTTRSNIDGGVQCLSKGPTVFAVYPPLHHYTIGSMSLC